MSTIKQINMRHNAFTGISLNFEKMPQIYDALDAVIAERIRQDKKWGIQNHDEGRWLLILQEEIGEWSQEVLDAKDSTRVREELVQVAAVALSMLECHDRIHRSKT